MKKCLKAVLITVIGILLIEAALIIAGAYSGIPDVSATKPEGGLMSWYLNLTKDNSIHARAKNVTVPPLEGPALLATGFEHYDEMCVTCHGAPGKEPDELARGLNPSPPDLAQSTKDMELSEMFVVVKYGIKMTGMPGFGPTHSDDKIWGIVAFLKRLQTMSPEDYSAFRK
jgi:mono/diheme cytochrome c family protein